MVKNGLQIQRILDVSNIFMSKVSIIGCGWLGLPLAVFLNEKGFEIKGSTTSKGKLETLEGLNIQGFLIRANEVLEGIALDVFFDSEVLIINIPPRRRRPDVETRHFTEIKNIIDTAIRGNVKKVIFCSSTGVYPDLNQIVTEETPCDPSTGSAKALLKIENYLKSKTSLQSTILRFSGLVGGDRKAGRFLAGKKEVANGDAPVNLVHRKDCIQIIYEILKQEAWNDVFNVCADKHPLRKDFYIQQAIKLDLKPPSFKTDEKGLFKIVSNEKLKRQLAYNFTFPDPSDF